MSYLLPSLLKKEDVDRAICDTLDKVLVLRFGRSSDVVCMKMDEIVYLDNFFLFCFLLYFSVSNLMFKQRIMIFIRFIHFTGINNRVFDLDLF